MQKKFHRSFDSLEDIFEFTESFFVGKNISQSIRYPVHFVMEELFTNMVKYNPGNSNDILLDVGTDNGDVTVQLTDFDVDNFDVSEIPDVDVDMSLEQRTPGGLGLHLIHKMVDSLKYQYEDRRSTVTFTKGT
jgi:serine/threonine-protein kinase RsbW